MDMLNLAQDIINQVHTVWEKNRKLYPDGYAVFYSALKSHPELFVLGVNPGGDVGSFSGKEKLFPENSSMEYIDYRNDNSYRIAGKTVSLFENADQFDMLKNSVKTNLNFFRSRGLDSLPKQDQKYCEEIVLKLINEVKPKVLFCEALGVFDKMFWNLYEGRNLHSRKELKRSDARKYVSCLSDDLNLPRLFIGIPHLTGKRPPSSQDLEIMTLLLKHDLHNIKQS